MTAPIPSYNEDEIDLREVWYSVARHWSIILLIAFVTSAASLYYAVNKVEPMFNATNVFMLEDSSPGFSGLGDAAGLAAIIGGGAGGDSATATISDRIRSRSFVLAIADDAGLYTDPQFNPVVRAPNLRARIQIALGISKPMVDSPAARDQRMIGFYREYVSVNVGEASMVEVSVEHYDPERAAKIANLIAEKALADILVERKEKSRAQIDYLAGELSVVQADLEKAAAAMSAYAVDNNLASGIELAKASTQLVRLREQRQSLGDTLSALEEFQQYTEERRILTPLERSELLNQYPFVASSEFRSIVGWGQSSDTWFWIDAETLAQARSTTQSRLEQAQRSISMLEQDARSTAASATELASLEREIKVQQSIYEALVAQFEAQSITSGFNASVGRVMEPAIPAIDPFKPRKVVYAALGMFLGGFITSVVIIVLVAMRGTIYGPNTISARIGLIAHSLRKRSVLKLLRTSVESGELEKIAVELELGEARQVVFLSLTSSDLASRAAFDLANELAASGQRTCLLDLTGEAFTGALVERGERQFALRRFEGERIFAYVSEPTSSMPALVLKSILPELRDEAAHIIVVCPKFPMAGAYVAALADEIDALVLIAERGRTTVSLTHSARAVLDRLARARAYLICE
ncbi:GNVR domain-containing protein [Marivivens sp. LCG002]|uniref:GumC family protein n=1 Tax=Marivivens sp. LCG002 TaxID=3051171 RepID=UPI0025568FE9|nr:GNVR domain-containing protein [Marivivens sp. LCG002]WIV51421.1 GNVR domain-containing protein [Marivivens sp. LCG002]